MKIDLVLTSCNLNNYYLNLYPYVFDVWKKRFDLDLYLILIADYIPNNLSQYSQYIILYEPIPEINTAYMAQVIRILYPCLFNNKNILITDIDIFPISKKYFIYSVEKYNSTQFISYTDRYVSNNMMAICYNLANSNIWKKIFDINNVLDVKNFLINYYNKKYNGSKNCDGWYLDQELLYIHIMKYIEKTKINNSITQNFSVDFSPVIFLNDYDIGYKRLDGKSANKLMHIKKNKLDIINNINTYSDFHIIRNYHTNLKLFEDIIQAIISTD